MTYRKRILLVKKPYPFIPCNKYTWKHLTRLLESTKHIYTMKQHYAPTLSQILTPPAVQNEDVKKEKEDLKKPTKILTK